MSRPDELFAQNNDDDVSRCVLFDSPPTISELPRFVSSAGLRVSDFTGAVGWSFSQCDILNSECDKFVRCVGGSDEARPNDVVAVSRWFDALTPVLFVLPPPPQLLNASFCCKACNDDVADKFRPKPLLTVVDVTPIEFVLLFDDRFKPPPFSECCCNCCAFNWWCGWWWWWWWWLLSNDDDVCANENDGELSDWFVVDVDAWL